MNDEELEAVIRRALTETVASVLADDLDTPRLNAITDRIHHAARQYGLDAYGITADRRAVLAEAGRKRRPA